MRFLIKEQDFEKPVAAGKFRYERDGFPTGSIESWRVTEAAEGYRFLRVDLDSREGESGESTLYHLVLTLDGFTERLKFWHFGIDGEIRGDLQVESEAIHLSRQLNEDRLEDILDTPEPVTFWFPTTLGLSLLLQNKLTNFPAETITLNRDNAFSLLRLRVDIECINEEEIVGTGANLSVRQCSIRWQSEQRHIWLDHHLLPVKIRRNDDLLGIETEYVRFLNA